MNKETKIIIVVAVVLIIAYFVIQKAKSSATPGTQAPPTTQPPVSNPVSAPDPGMSTPAAVSQPNPVSQPAPLSEVADVVQPGIIPVAISAPAGVFISQPTDAEVQGGSAVPVASDPLQGLPSGFITWANSLGPKNYAHLLTVLPSMTPTDISFINNMVTKNLWGQSSVALQWNTFVKNYGFPVGLSFNNFN